MGINVSPIALIRERTNHGYLFGQSKSNLLKACPVKQQQQIQDEHDRKALDILSIEN